MSFVRVVDNVASKEIFDLASKHFQKSIWGLNNYSSVNDTNAGLGATDYCEEVNKLISENRFNESNILYNLWLEVNKKFNMEKNFKNELWKIHLNLGLPLTDQTIHQDDIMSTFSKDMTIVYFLNETWHENYGGELVVFDTSRTRITAGSFPVPNRACLFESYLPHRGVTISRICPIARISIAFQCKYNNTL
tara:strand:- start:8709 stop:9284 length:576 start_codon:yes stop_codon:yes gene_type:complete